MRERSRAPRTLFALTVLTLLVAPAAAAAPGPADADAEALVVRYAVLVGGRTAGTAPVAAGVLSPEELSDLLLEWEPEADNEEVRQVFALNEIGELVRQAVELPAVGGGVSGSYEHGGVRYDVALEVRSLPPSDGGDDVVRIGATVARDGATLSRPTIHARLGERSIVTSRNGPEAPFLFVVVEVDRMTRDELARRGLRHALRKDYLLVDGVEVQAPVVVDKVVPSYTPEARDAGVEGRVVLRALIDETGAVSEVEVVEGLSHGLSAQAVAAVEQWRFEPALSDGEPVAVLYLLTINFRLG